MCCLLMTPKYDYSFVQTYGTGLIGMMYFNIINAPTWRKLVIGKKYNMVMFPPTYCCCFIQRFSFLCHTRYDAMYVIANRQFLKGKAQILISGIRMQLPLTQVFKANKSMVVICCACDEWQSKPNGPSCEDSLLLCALSTLPWSKRRKYTWQFILFKSCCVRTGLITSIRPETWPMWQRGAPVWPGERSVQVHPNWHLAHSTRKAGLPHAAIHISRCRL